MVVDRIIATGVGIKLTVSSVDDSIIAENATNTSIRNADQIG
jgi:ABC-type Fe2+-enterobactin transport system substrate-binding protein